MTDQQFQPGQPTPPTPPTQDPIIIQNEGVFGGNAEEALHDESVFGQLENTEQTEDKTDEDSLNPFDGYQIPEEMGKIDEDQVLDTNLTINEETPIIEDEEINFDIQENKNNEIELETEDKDEEINFDIEETKNEDDEVNLDTQETEEIVEQKIENEEETEQIIPENIQVEELEVEEEEEEISDIKQKFLNLSENIVEINSILKPKNGEIIEVVGSNNDKISVLYQFVINEQKEVQIKRIESKKDEDTASFNELKLFIEAESNLFQIFLDNVLLFDESDFTDDKKKKSQVMEKINKFIFLTEGKLKDIQKELRAKQEENNERRRLQDIFRNF